MRPPELDAHSATGNDASGSRCRALTPEPQSKWSISNFFYQCSLHLPSVASRRFGARKYEVLSLGAGTFSFSSLFCLLVNVDLLDLVLFLSSVPGLGLSGTLPKLLRRRLLTDQSYGTLSDFWTFGRPRGFAGCELLFHQAVSPGLV